MSIPSDIPSAFLLEGVIKKYEWGSTDLLPALLKRAQDGEPWAEYWLGTHSRGSAVAKLDSGPIALTSLLEAPLPFLMKFLGIAKPLSVQVHPNLSEARAGFDLENQLGVPIDSSNRVFVDSCDKPEQICALTDVWALSGFRPVEEIRNLTAPLAAYLPRVEGTPGDAFLALFEMDSTGRSLALDELARMQGTLAISDEWRWVFDLLEQRPGDITVLAPLYLNLVHLQRHESLFLRAGLIHAYLSGLAVEVMGASDNVVRAGLTSKHIDLPQLSKLVDKQSTPPHVLKGNAGNDGWTSWASDSPYFTLSFVELNDASCHISGPAVLVCVDGNIELTDTRSPLLAIGSGEAAFVAADSMCTVKGTGSLYACAVNPNAHQMLST